MEKYYIGTELKFALTITSEGFDMDTDPWIAKVQCGKKVVNRSKEEGAVIDDSQWYILIDSAILGVGPYYLIVEIDVPDDDFDDGYRHEVLKTGRPICNVIKI